MDQADPFFRIANMLCSYAREDRNGNEANVVDALFAIADALESISTQLKYLGNGNASTSMGAIEAFGLHIGEKIESFGMQVSGSIDSLTDALKPEE